MDFKARPPSVVPVPFMALGLLGLLAAAVAAVLDPAVALHDHPGAAGLGFLHLITLGFLAPVMIGAYYQLVPVVLRAPVSRPGWGRAVFAALAVGVVVFLLGWWLLLPWAVAGGGVLAGLALLAFVAHVGAALGRLRAWSASAVAFAAALLALAAVGVLGPLMATRVGGDPVAAHAAAGLGGWLLLTIVGATYVLVPFFAATPPVVRPRLAYASVGLVAAGTALIALGAPAVGGGLAVIGVLLWATDLARLAWHGRQARREAIVWYTALAVVLIVLGALGAEADLLGAAIPARVVALVGLLAGPALLVMGQLQKILPFLEALDARGVKTEQLFSRGLAFRVLPPAAAGLLGIAAASAAGSPLLVRLAAVLAALAIGAYVAQQGRALATSRSSRRPPPARSR
jgi:hypothetical protein